ncbi:MAG TPA: hypothetical protein VLH08_03680 [Acidobacteriota bacterium]|nr:hypothetical protein [Acidobacteriota bacterium]
MIWFLFILIAAFFALYTILPFFEKAYRNRHLPVDTGELENILNRKEEVISALNDLEYDFRLKKIGEPDYLQLKEKLSLEAIELMKRADQLSVRSSQKAVNADTAKLRS